MIVFVFCFGIVVIFYKKKPNNICKSQSTAKTISPEWSAWLIALLQHPISIISEQIFYFSWNERCATSWPTACA